MTETNQPIPAVCEETQTAHDTPACHSQQHIIQSKIIESTQKYTILVLLQLYKDHRKKNANTIKRCVLREQEPHAVKIYENSFKNNFTRSKVKVKHETFISFTDQV